ncbi:NAD-P-binding protein [Cubamyces menziesii]|nr:NAD-P-binding protein [Cubamyces menziesii]
MSHHTWLVTGWASPTCLVSIELATDAYPCSSRTNRGIGFGIVQQLIASPSNVVLATCRNPTQATALAQLAETAGGRLHIIQLDVSDDTSVRRSVEQVSSIVGESGIDYLINNAGMIEEVWTVPSTMDLAALNREFQVNVIGPARVYQAYLPLVAKSQKKTIVNISSDLGSIGRNRGIMATSYSITKSALNMLTAHQQTYKERVERPDLIVIALDPGHVKTDMGGPTAPFEVPESVSGMLGVIGRLKAEDTGKFFSFRGEEHPW